MDDPSETLHFATPQEVLARSDQRLVDVIDTLLDAGVVLRGELWLTVADIELVFVGVDLVLASPDRMQGVGDQDARNLQPSARPRVSA
ncbi:MAG: gas vesicle protein [Pseudomonadota bacterium]